MKKTFQLAAKACFIFLLLLILAWMGIWGYLQTEKGQKHAIQLVMDFFETRTGFVLSTEQVNIQFPLGLHAHHVVVSQGDAPLATIQEIRLLFDLPKLIEARLVFNLLEMRGVELISKPFEATPQEEAAPFTGKSLIPFYVKIDKIHVYHLRFGLNFLKQLHLPAQIIDNALDKDFTIKGSIANNPFTNNLSAQLLVENNTDQSLTLQLSKGNLDLSYHGTLQAPWKENQVNIQSSVFASTSISEFLQNIEGKFKFQSDLPSIGDVLVKGNYAWEKDTGLFLTLDELQAKEMQLHGELQLNPSFEAIDATFVGVLQNLESLCQITGQPFLGKAHFNGHLSGPLFHPQIELTAASSNFQWKNVNLKDLQASIQWQENSATLEISTSYAELPCCLSSFITHNDGKIHFSTIKGSVKDDTVQGNLAYDTANCKLQGHLTLSINDIKTFSHPFGLPLSGKASLQLDILPSTNSQIVTWSLLGENVQWREIRIKTLEANSSFESIIWEIKPIHFHMKDAQILDHLFDNLAGQSFYNFHTKEGSIVLNGSAPDKKLAFGLEGKFNLANQPFLLLSQARGQLGEHSFQLLNPLSLHGDEQTLRFDQLHLRYGEAEISSSFSSIKDEIEWHFSTNAFPLHRYIKNPSFEGIFSLQGSIKGNGKSPSGSIDAKLHQFTLPEGINAKEIQGNGLIHFEINKGEIALKSQINGFGPSPIFVEGLLPYQMGLIPLRLDSNAKKMNLHIEANGPLKPYLELFLKDPLPLTGQTKMNLQLTGTWENPFLQGKIDLSDGTYEPDGGTRYHHITAHLEGEGPKLIVKRFSAENDKNGSVIGSGILHLNSEEEFPLDIWLQPKNLMILDSESARIAASGQLHLTGNRKRAKLEGELTSESAYIDIEGTLPKQIKTLDVQYVNWPEGASPPHEEPKSFSSLEFNIKLHLNNHVMIEGKNLHSRWKGQMLIEGTPQAPLLYGDLRVSKGDYNFNGKVFDLTQGTIHFNGAPGKKTSIYVVASKEIGNIRADIIVKGIVNKLGVTFRSNPPLSQREILSYILFNRGIGDITPDQGNQLSQSFIELNSGEQSSGGDDFLSRARKVLSFFDRLDIDPQSVQAGKYIMEGVYVSIDKTKDMGNRVIIEADVLKKLKAQAEVPIGSEGQQKFSLKWKKDY